MDKSDWETPPEGAEIWADEYGFCYFDDTLEAWIDFDPPEWWIEKAEADINAALTKPH